MRLKVGTLLLVLVVLQQGKSLAVELKAAVKYVSADAIYLDHGKASGIQVGDTVFIRRNDEPIATLEILHLASSSAACKVIEKRAEILTGDEAIVSISAPEAPILDQTESAVPLIDTSQLVFTQRLLKPKAKPYSRLKGRASLQLYGQSGEGETLLQPSLYLQGELSDIARKGLSLKVRARARQSSNSRNSKGVWSNRLYELSLGREASDANASGWWIGRLAFRQAPGVGYIDGGAFDVLHSRILSFGGFAGLDPEQGGGAPQWNRIKTGAYARYVSGDYGSPRRIASTVALIGSYQGGNPDREYLYFDNDIAFRNNLSIYQGAEVELNRGWRNEAEGGALKLSSLMLTARWNFSKVATLSGGYDDRTPYRDLDNRDTPDSLFDDALRRGFRLGLSIRLPWRGRISLDGNMGLTEGHDPSKAGSLNLYQPNFLNTKVNASFRASLYTSSYSNGWQPSLSLSKQVFRDVGMTVQGGVSNYVFSGINRTSQSSRWIRAGMDYWVGRRYYGSASVEVQRGGGWDGERIYLEFGARL